MEDKLFGGRGISNRHWVNPTGPFMRDIPEGAIEPEGEDILILIPPMVLLETLK